MVSFKALDSSNVFTTDYVARKDWKVDGSELSKEGIGILLAESGSHPYYPVVSDLKPFLRGQEKVSGSYESGSYYPRLLYESVKHLYYDGSLGNGTFTGSADLSLQTSLSVSGSRKLSSQEKLLVISIPTKLFGQSIVEGSFKLQFADDALFYVATNYIDEGYFEDDILGDIQDIEGLLVYDSDTEVAGLHKGDIVGDFIGSQGIAIITNKFFAEYVYKYAPESILWTSEVCIFTENIKCTVLDSEFNYSTNPTAKRFIGDSKFTPYISSVGLYNTDGDLLAVGKLSRPVRKLDDIDTTLSIRLDIS